MNMEEPECTDSLEQKEQSQRHLSAEGQSDPAAWAQSDQGAQLPQHKESSWHNLFSAPKNQQWD